MPGPNYPYTKLDHEQALTQGFDEALDVHRVLGIGGTLVPEDYTSITLTYVAAGNGVGEIETVTYVKGAAPVATLTLSYDAQNRLVQVDRT